MQTVIFMLTWNIIYEIQMIYSIYLCWLLNMFQDCLIIQSVIKDPNFIHRTLVIHYIPHQIHPGNNGAQRILDPPLIDDRRLSRILSVWCEHSIDIISDSVTDIYRRYSVIRTFIVNTQIRTLRCAVYHNWHFFILLVLFIERFVLVLQSATR